MKSVGFQLGCLLWVLCYSTLAVGTTLEELQASGQLRIDSALAPDGVIVPGQRVELSLEIATDTWFTGGTRIVIPEVPGLVILQTEQFASNASETRAGQSWVVQRWTLDVFPQRTGDFTVGPVAVHVRVNAGGDGDVRGELRGPARQFSVAIPESLARMEQWVAAPAYTVRQRFDRSLADLTVGDAFEQEIVFEASDVLAMMLPVYTSERQAGLAAYPAPPVLNNSVNRGQTLASRRERISYVVEQVGQYRLPAREYLWWNTQSAKLEVLSLPETRIDVAGAIADSPAASPAISPRQLLTVVVALALLAASLRLVLVYIPRLPWARVAARLSALARRLQALRRPALGTRLNPGSSAGE